MISDGTGIRVDGDALHWLPPIMPRTGRQLTDEEREQRVARQKTIAREIEASGHVAVDWDINGEMWFCVAGYVTGCRIVSKAEWDRYNALLNEAAEIADGWYHNAPWVQDKYPEVDAELIIRAIEAPETLRVEE